MTEQPLKTAPAEILPAERSKPAFTSTKKEGICALLSYLAAYLYAYDFYAVPAHLAGVAVLLILITELLNSDRKPAVESFIWLGCFVMCTVSAVFRLGRTWDEDQTYLFIHIFAVWWILSRSGKLLEGKSGHLLPFDVINGFFRIPFPNFFLRIRSLFFHIRQLFSKRGTEKRKHNFWTIPAVLILLLLFARAFSLLMQADAAFGDFFRNLSEFFRFDIDEDALFCFFLSLPIGAWLFGLMGGSVRMQPEKLEKERGRIGSFLERIRKIPVVFWICTVGVFSLLYLGFFILQGSYLFGAFTRTLPEGFIVSQYAREGFFELCKVMAVNFTVLWLVTRMASAEASRSRVFLAVCLVLLAESMLFAVIAFSKLYLYISCFGFTPKRLQSAWLICVLFAGCVLWAYTLLTEKPVFRKWMVFGAVSLSVLTLI